MDASIFKIKLEEIKNRLESHENFYRSNESAVRSQIVEPLLEALGWNPKDPREVIPEPGTEEGHPDYELKWQNKSCLLIEVKNLSKEPETALRQLGKYCYSNGVRFAVATNGAVWVLFRSFEEGTSVHERTVWKIDLRSDSTDRIYGKLRTIARESVASLDDLIKKEQMLEEIWSRQVENPGPELVNAVAEVIRAIISDKTLKFEEGEIESFIVTKFKEINYLEPTHRVIEPSQESPGDQVRQNKGIRIRGQFLPASKSYEILIQTVEWLIRQRKLTSRDVPIEAGYKRYLINREPKHRNREDFSQPQQLSNGLYIETKFSTRTHIKHAKTLLKRFGYAENDLEVSGF